MPHPHNMITSPATSVDCAHDLSERRRDSFNA